MGIYFDFKPLRSSSVMVSFLTVWVWKALMHCAIIYIRVHMLRPLCLSPQDLPTVMHGAVLAFGGNAPNNGCAISVSFGSIGYATALARVFQWVRYTHIHLRHATEFTSPQVQRKKTYLLRIMMHCIQKKSYVAPEWVIHYLCVAMYMTVVSSTGHRN